MKGLKVLSFIFALTLIYDIIYSFLSIDEGYKIVSFSVNVWVYRLYKLMVVALLLGFGIRRNKLEMERKQSEYNSTNHMG